MENKYKGIHSLTSIMLNIMLLIVVLISQNPVILLGVFIFNTLIIVSSNNIKKLKSSLIYFIPFFIIGFIINSIFNNEGNRVIFTILSKEFTLEAMIYSLIFSFKLLSVIHIFINLSIMVDSDKALSYFSKLLPKTTLTVMIGLKLFPTMNNRLRALKEVYSIRGVNFQGDRLRDKIKGYIPIFSVLLESSLEGAFDIGEAAYVRGFLSGKRSIYDKQSFKREDYIFIIQGIIILIGAVIESLINTTKYGFNKESISVFLLIMILCLSIFLLNMRKESGHELY